MQSFASVFYESKPTNSFGMFVKILCGGNVNMADDPDRKPRAYLSVDAEFDGDDMTRNSMRELAAVLHLENKTVVDKFDVKILPIEGRVVDDKCMREFWNHQPDAWQWVQADAVTPHDAMTQFAEFLSKHCATYSIRFVAAPASLDIPWIKYYYNSFAPPESISLHWDVYCLGSLRKAHRRINRLTEAEEWDARKSMQEGFPYTHKAVDDAMAQAIEFCNLWSSLREYGKSASNAQAEAMRVVVKSAFSELKTTANAHDGLPALPAPDVYAEVKQAIHDAKREAIDSTPKRNGGGSTTWNWLTKMAHHPMLPFYVLCLCAATWNASRQ